MTSVLESSKFWLGHRTFKLSPKVFLSIIHPSCISSRHCPCLFTRSPSKQSKKRHNRLLDVLDTFAPESMPDKVLLDFEIAPINAFQKHYSASMLSGCYFHLPQNFVRKIGELGLEKLVSENQEVALALKVIPTLTFEKKRKSKKLLICMSRK